MNKGKWIVLVCLFLVAAGIVGYVMTRPTAPDTSKASSFNDSKQAPFNLDKAVSNAILAKNRGSYSAGECQGEGHYIMDSTTDGTTVIAYALAMYGEYGFEDGNFVKVSGSGVIPTVITFSKDEAGTYSMVNYQEPEDGEGYAASIRRLFPIALQSQCLNISASRAKKLQTQEQAYAAVYLKSIGRAAAIGDYGDFDHPLLTSLGVSVEVSNMMCENRKLSNYPLWVGNLERLEDGIRYVYQVDYDQEAHVITYSKRKYDTKTVAEKFVFDSTSGKEIPQS